MSPHSPRLILASTSPYRREMLARLRIPFTAVPFYNGTAWFRPLMTWWFRAKDAWRGN